MSDETSADRPGGGSRERAGKDSASHDPAGKDSAGHDPSGLDLARSIARAMGRTPRADESRSDRRRRDTGPLARRRRRATEAQSSGARPDDRDPQTLDATIGRLVAEHGWGTDVAVHGVFSRWDTIVGREVAEHCHPERFADSRLTVRADSTAWATQVRLLAPTVVRRLNEELGDGTVTAIDVQGPSVPSWSKGFRAVRDGRGPRDTYG
ncbi:MAG TPA: DciA family protein [Nocardioidaceae bacterium]|nr:DciA family protein [Nocardioidaceae bacterium]